MHVVMPGDPTALCDLCELDETYVLVSCEERGPSRYLHGAFRLKKKDILLN